MKGIQYRRRSTKENKFKESKAEFKAPKKKSKWHTVLEHLIKQFRQIKIQLLSFVQFVIRKCKMKSKLGQEKLHGIDIKETVMSTSVILVDGNFIVNDVNIMGGTLFHI